MQVSELIDSLGDFVEDAVLIAEAEPIDQPGPRVVWCNSAFEEMTGYSKANIIGQSPRILQGEATDGSVSV